MGKIRVFYFNSIVMLEQSKWVYPSSYLQKCIIQVYLLINLLLQWHEIKFIRYDVAKLRPNVI